MLKKRKRELDRSPIIFQDAESWWCAAFRILCSDLDLVPLRFLGSGAYGRVVEVENTNGDRRALKVVLGRSHADQLVLEHARLVALVNAPRSQDLSLPPLPVPAWVGDAPVTVLDTEVLTSNRTFAAAFCTGPVASHRVSVSWMKKNPLNFYEGFHTAYVLHRHSVSHGDMRPDNLVSLNNADLPTVKTQVEKAEADRKEQNEVTKIAQAMHQVKLKSDRFRVHRAPSALAISLSQISLSSPSPLSYFFIDFRDGGPSTTRADFVQDIKIFLKCISPKFDFAAHSFRNTYESLLDIPSYSESIAGFKSLSNSIFETVTSDPYNISIMSDSDSSPSPSPPSSL
jgi:hypothetical protein